MSVLDANKKMQYDKEKNNLDHTRTHVHAALQPWAC